ncbi:MAG: single-stranded DNA-binding protein [Sporomusaceae bacterium]|jgi:single-strand DNA-binding protein|nr:single-stranded DNA-binding protein [Sporomusaceae bacterium]
MNQVSLMGRITQEPEIRYGQSGTAVAKYYLAVPKISKGAKGVDFIQCVSFGKTAETIGNYVVKGQQLGISGRLDTGKYNTNEGDTRYYTQVVTSDVTFGAKPKSQQSFASSSFADEEIPF